MRVEGRMLVLEALDLRDVVVDAIREAKRHRLMEIAENEAPIAVAVCGVDGEGEIHALWNGPVEIRIQFNPPPVAHGYRMSWREYPWSDVTSVGVFNAATPLEARVKAQELAIQSGWTPRRWWQIWRLNEGA